MRPPGGGRRSQPPPTSAPAHKGAGAAIGRPDALAPEPMKSNAHDVWLYNRWQNAKALGRNQTFAVWANHNGYGPDTYDLFWDGVV